MRVAFVVQRCGREVNGGAEAHCLQVAQRLARHCQIDILTTCALDYMTWANYYPPGEEHVDGTTILRFPVDVPRDVERFNQFSAELHARQASSTLDEQEHWMRLQGPISSALFAFLEENESTYDAFIFFGYLYATTYFGLPRVERKAFLVPMGHDEWPIYFSMWDTFFSRPRELIFNTTFERDFLRRRFAGLRLRGPVVGIGIEPPADVDAARFRERYGLNDRFLLYVGRIDESKGCRWMIDNFIRARNAGRLDKRLVLAGTEVMPIPFHDDVLHLGFIDEEQKWDAMAACDWLVMPSPHESLSIVLLETWAAGRPAIVTAQGDVLIGHCRSSNGGLWYEDWNQFEVICQTVDAGTKVRLGEQGRRYVADRYSWRRVEAQYLRLLSD